MYNKFSDGVLNGLYEVRSEDFERFFHKELTERLNKIGVTEKVEELKEFMKKQFGEYSETIEEFEKISSKIEDAVLAEMSFWFKKYYKLGFCDAKTLKNETKEFSEKNTISKDKSFFNEYFDVFSGYFEDYKFNYLRNKPEYRKITNEIKKIKDENPKVTELVEDGNIESLNTEELKAVQKLFLLGEQLDSFEQKEIYRLGMKEMLVNLAEMDIINLPPNKTNI